MDDLPELVQDSELEATVRGAITIHDRPIGCRGNASQQEWIFEENFGRGGDGVVSLHRKIKGPGTIDCLAVKQMRLDAPLASDNHNCRRYVRELKALAKFSQDSFTNFFVRSYGWYVHASQLYIAMENCEHKDLGTYLKDLRTRKEMLSEESVRMIASQVVQGLSLMHKNRFAHRDLKPANILIKRQPPEAWWVVLADLGLSRRNEDASGSTTVRGSQGFMAPETIGTPFNGRPNDANFFYADMWCVGETVSYALTGRPTFRDRDHLLDYQLGHVDFPDEGLQTVNASEQVVHFVTALMKAEPNQRLTAQQARGHPWLVRNSRDVSEKNITTYVTSHVIPMAGQSNESFTTDQMTQASAQWTATVPIPIDDAGEHGRQEVDEAQPNVQLHQPLDKTDDTSVDTYVDFSQSPTDWDQFAANERLFGIVGNDFDETLYTTKIDFDDPRYQERAARAEKIALEIESMPYRSKPDDHVDEAGAKIQAAGVHAYIAPVPKVDPDETLHTTKIDLDDPRYRERAARAEKLALEIESTPYRSIPDDHVDEAGAKIQATGVHAYIAPDLDIPETNNVSSLERLHEQLRQRRVVRERQSKKIVLDELKSFSKEFRFDKPIPVDLVPILAKDEAKQEQLRQKGLQSSESAVTRNDAAKVQINRDQPSVSGTPSKATTALPRAASAKPQPQNSRGKDVSAIETPAAGGSEPSTWQVAGKKRNKKRAGKGQQIRLG